MWEQLGQNKVVHWHQTVYTTVEKLAKQQYKANQNRDHYQYSIRKQNHEKTLEIAELHTGMGREALDGIYNDYRYEVRLSQELIELLNKESEWAMDSGVSKAAKKPDFRESVYTDALKEINSSRVKVK